MKKASDHLLQQNEYIRQRIQSLENEVKRLKLVLLFYKVCIFALFFVIALGIAVLNSL